jgi:hypothetical protein
VKQRKRGSARQRTTREENAVLVRFGPFRGLDDFGGQRRDASWTRSMPLDAYRIGVLRLSIPVAERAKARRIDVRTSEEKEAITTASAS